MICKFLIFRCITQRGKGLAMMDLLRTRVKKSEVKDCTRMQSARRLARYAPHCRSGTDQEIGGDELLSAELVGLAGGRGAEVSDYSAVGVVGDGLLDGAGRAVDDSAVVAEVVIHHQNL